MHNAIHIRWLHLVTKSMRLLNLVKEKSLSTQWDPQMNRPVYIVIVQRRRAASLPEQCQNTWRYFPRNDWFVHWNFRWDTRPRTSSLATDESLLTFPSVFAYSLWLADRDWWFLPLSVDKECWQARRRTSKNLRGGIRSFTWCSLLTKCQSRERLDLISSGSLISIRTLFSKVLSFSTESVRCRFLVRCLLESSKQFPWSTNIHPEINRYLSMWQWSMKNHDYHQHCCWKAVKWDHLEWASYVSSLTLFHRFSSSPIFC